MDQPLAALALDVHLKVHTLEDDIVHHAHKLTFHRGYHLDILRAHHHLHALLPGKAAVHAGEIHAGEGHQKVPVHHAVHNVGIADKVCHKGVFRLVVDILRGADLLHLAAVHDHDGIRHGKRFFLIVGDIDKGDVHLALQPLELQLHLLAQLQVQCAQRLVQQQNLRLVDQTAGNGHALLLTAGHLADAAALEAL